MLYRYAKTVYHKHQIALVYDIPASVYKSGTFSIHPQVFIDSKAACQCICVRIIMTCTIMLSNCNKSLSFIISSLNSYINSFSHMCIYGCFKSSHYFRYGNSSELLSFSSNIELYCRILYAFIHFASSPVASSTCIKHSFFFE